MMSPIRVTTTTHQQSYASFLATYGGGKGKAAKDKEEDEESEESIAWKMRATQLLEDGRRIYGSDAQSQLVFNMLVSHGEEARLKRAADLEMKRIRSYAAMSPFEAWLWAAFRGVYLYAPMAFILWLVALVAGFQDWKAAIVCGVFVAALIWQRRRWMDSYARRSLTDEAPE